MPTRVKIGSPKNAGTFSSISEWVLMNVKVASGKTRVSLWQEPGRGSGTCKFTQKEERWEKGKQIVVD